jgi:hypothetical protein
MLPSYTDDLLWIVLIVFLISGIIVLSILVRLIVNSASEQRDTTYEADEYHQHGFLNREDYLQYLAYAHHTDIETIHCFADRLEAREDFLGLITALEETDMGTE